MDQRVLRSHGEARVDVFGPGRQSDGVLSADHRITWIGQAERWPSSVSFFFLRSFFFGVKPTGLGWESGWRYVEVFGFMSHKFSCHSSATQKEEIGTRVAVLS